MKCNTCGSSADVGTKFCAQCGSKIIEYNSEKWFRTIEQVQNLPKISFGSNDPFDDPVELFVEFADGYDLVDRPQLDNPKGNNWPYARLYQINLNSSDPATYSYLRYEGNWNKLREIISGSEVNNFLKGEGNIYQLSQDPAVTPILYYSGQIENGLANGKGLRKFNRYLTGHVVSFESDHFKDDVICGYTRYSYRSIEISGHFDQSVDRWFNATMYSNDKLRFCGDLAENPEELGDPYLLHGIGECFNYNDEGGTINGLWKYGNLISEIDSDKDDDNDNDNDNEDYDDNDPLGLRD